MWFFIFPQAPVASETAYYQSTLVHSVAVVRVAHFHCTHEERFVFLMDAQYPKSGTWSKFGSRSDLRWVANLPMNSSKNGNILLLFVFQFSTPVRKYQEDSLWITRIICFTVDGSPHLVDRSNWVANWKSLGTPVLNHGASVSEYASYLLPW